MDDQNDSALLELLRTQRESLHREIGKVIVGQEASIDLMLTALFAKGHCLLVGVPGLAKTTLINSLARVLDLTFNRIQCTPDLMPADITGSDVMEEDKATKERYFRFVKGPMFTNLLLADEINRTSPKTQSALLQAMQEYRVTASGTTYDLEPPFMVYATQNPIEQEGTYQLPEAQLDRFMFHIDITYPSEAEELRIAQTTTNAAAQPLEKVMTRQQLLELQDFVLRVPVAETILLQAVRLVRATRPDKSLGDAYINDNVAWGAGPRAVQHLILAAKAKAVLEGRACPSLDDLRSLAKPVLKHRVLVNYRAEAKGIKSDAILEYLLERVLG